MSKRKLKAIWTLLRAKHYAVLTGDSENEIGWAIKILNAADSRSKDEEGGDG